MKDHSRRRFGLHAVGSLAVFCANGARGQVPALGASSSVFGVPAGTTEIATVKKQVLGRLPLTVPADFISINAHNWPIGMYGRVDPDPNGHLRLGQYRTHDGPATQWRDIEKSAGVYDWTNLDRIISAWRGKPITFTVYGTPIFYVQSGRDTLDPYGNAGGSQPPKPVAALGRFVSALVSRYGNAITTIEPWNEPTFSGEQDGFFVGSATEMVSMVTTVRAAVRLRSKTIRVSSPGLNNVTSLAQFLAAYDPATGLKGSQVIDALAYHPYVVVPRSGTGMTNVQSMPPNGFVEVVGQIQDVLNRQSIPSMPVMFTEYGFSFAQGDAVHQAFLALSASERRLALLRTLGASAALGIKSFSIYAYGNTLAGDLISDKDGVISAVNYFASEIVGQTLIEAQQYTSGTLRLKRSDGKIFEW